MFNINFDVKTTVLENKLKVITIKKDTQISAINVGLKVGANNEEMCEKGVSHFIEHMMFKGTKKRNNEKLNEDLEFLGGEYNAYTDYDATVYTISCLGEELESAVELLSDMIINSSFDTEEVEKERGVILSEIKSGIDDIEDLSFQKINEVAFNKSPLKYEVTGLEENVEKFTREDIVEYYNKYYNPDNAIISVVSSMEHEEILDIIKNNFAKWQGVTKKSLVNVKEDNNNVKVVNYKNNIEQSTIMYLFTFYNLSKEEELPLRILNHRLGESANSLLFREIREKRGLAYDIYTHLNITNDIKTLYIYTAVSNEDTEETVKAIDELLDKIVNGNIKIGEKDLQVMKKVHKTAVVSTIEDSAELCNYILHQSLDDEDIFEFEKDMHNLNNITEKDIFDVARKVLNNPTIHILKSKKE